MSKEEIKKLENEEAADKTATPEDQKKTDDKAEKKPGKVKQFFIDHKNKIAAGAGVVGAVGVGIIVDRLGIKIGAGKKKADEPSDEQAE